MTHEAEEFAGPGPDLGSEKGGLKTMITSDTLRQRRK